MADTENLVAEIEALESKLAEAKQAITKRFIGQEQVVDLTLSALLCGGHALLIGLPGLGKTRLVGSTLLCYQRLCLSGAGEAPVEIVALEADQGKLNQDGNHH